MRHRHEIYVINYSHTIHNTSRAEILDSMEHQYFDHHYMSYLIVTEKEIKESIGKIEKLMNEYAKQCNPDSKNDSDQQ